MRLLGLLSEAALEVSSQLPAGHVELRLAGEEPSLVYVSDEAATQPTQVDDALTARITLRLPDSLKTSLEAAAAQDGVSLNSWIVKALARGLTLAATSRIGSRLTGFGQS
jgi:HicB family